MFGLLRVFNGTAFSDNVNFDLTGIFKFGFDLIRDISCKNCHVVVRNIFGASGDTGAVRASLEAGKAAGGEFVVDTLLIPSVHEQVFPAISGTVEVTDPQAVGVIEYYSIASAIEAADAAAKAAQITLIEVRTGYAIGGKGFVVLTGDVGAVRAAIEQNR